MSTFIWVALMVLAAIGGLTLICCLLCTVGVVLCCRYAPRIDEYEFAESDAGDDRQCGRDASMNYEHEAATGGGRDTTDTEDLWSRR